MQAEGDKGKLLSCSALLNCLCPPAAQALQIKRYYLSLSPLCPLLNSLNSQRRADTGQPLRRNKKFDQATFPEKILLSGKVRISEAVYKNI